VLEQARKFISLRIPRGRLLAYCVLRIAYCVLRIAYCVLRIAYCVIRASCPAFLVDRSINLMKRLGVTANLRDPHEGYWHDYSTLKFVPEASVPLYASEVGRASAPSLSSMKLFLSEEELWPEGYSPAIRTPGRAAWPEMWQYRSVGGSWDKVGRVGDYCDPVTTAVKVRTNSITGGRIHRGIN